MLYAPPRKVNDLIERIQEILSQERVSVSQQDGKLSNQENRGAEGRAFLEGQLVKSGQLLGQLWVTAWQTAPPDTFLERELHRRASPEKAAGAK